MEGTVLLTRYKVSAQVARIQQLISLAETAYWQAQLISYCVMN